jgi:hypothetical protein
MYSDVSEEPFGKSWNLIFSRSVSVASTSINLEKELILGHYWGILLYASVDNIQIHPRLI